MPSDFAHLGLPAALVAALARGGITEPFPIQTATIPDGLAGRDVAAQAPTGSGKTLAFGLSTLANVPSARAKAPTALVLSPTRELAEQIRGELAPLAKAVHRSVTAIYGGVGYGPQLKALRSGVDVLVATPGRLEDLLEQRSLTLKDVEIVVVDEADRMADMGFLPAVKRILGQTRKERQTMLYSATLDGDVGVLVRDHQKSPARHTTGHADSAASDARHHFWKVEHTDRVEHTADAVQAAGRSIVFTRTRHGADRLAKQLGRLGVSAVPIHGGRSQSQRSRALREFSAGRAPALIATDVAARGIHVDDVAAVIHFDPPADHKDYVHRSGRTARAGADGTVLTLVTRDTEKAVRRMQKSLGLDGTIRRPDLDDLRSGGTTVKPAAATPPTETRRPARAAERAPRKEREATGGTQSVYVANLPWSVDEDEVTDLFEQYGHVRRTSIISDRRTGRSRGFGFVEMGVADARSAVDALHGADLGGRDLTVRLADPRPSRR
jgi:superfamily II DNA/RNA helicase